MLLKTIEFKDLKGDPVKRDYFFNLSIDEITELEFSRGSGFANELQRMVEEKNAGDLLAAFREIIMKSVGQPDEDGITFHKENEKGQSLGRNFMRSNAYTVLFLELLGPSSGDEAFVEFLKGVVPPELLEGMPDSFEVPGISEPPKELTRDEMLALSDEEFNAKFGVDPTKWSAAVLQAAYQRKSRPTSGG